MWKHVSTTDVKLFFQMLYENGVNGILADEMGLGKTIQCIALVCHLLANGSEGPFFLCAPLSTIPNWIAEFARFAPKVVMHLLFLSIILSWHCYDSIVGTRDTYDNV
jgi:SNF2 family DNA or RNA helicase